MYERLRSTASQIFELEKQAPDHALISKTEKEYLFSLLCYI